VRTRSEIVRLAESKVGRCASNHKMRDLLPRKSKSPWLGNESAADSSPPPSLFLQLDWDYLAIDTIIYFSSPRKGLP
jgi:hypothetical protein